MKTFILGMSTISSLLFNSSTKESHGFPTEFYESVIPTQLQKLEFCQGQRPRFNLIEAASIQIDRCDAEGVKGGEGKNQFLKLFGYITKVNQKQNHIFSDLYSLLDEGSYKSHFIGIRYLLGIVDILKKSFFLNDIRNHPYFTGFSERIKLTEVNDSMGKSHFYLEHPKGIRHFTIEQSQIGDSIAYRLENATQKHYPTLERFISSTLG